MVTETDKSGYDLIVKCKKINSTIEHESDNAEADLSSHHMIQITQHYVLYLISIVLRFFYFRIIRTVQSHHFIQITHLVWLYYHPI